MSTLASICRNPIAWVRANGAALSSIVKYWNSNGTIGSGIQTGCAACVVARSTVEIPIGDDEDSVSYAAAETAFLAANTNASSAVIAEYTILSGIAEDRIADAGIDPATKNFLFYGSKTAGQSHRVEVTFNGFA